MHRQSENTLDLIESCLDRIYNIRKHQLELKSRKFQENQKFEARRRSILESNPNKALIILDEEEFGTSASSSSNNKAINKNNNPNNLTEEELDEETLINQLSTKYTSLAPTVPPKNKASSNVNKSKKSPINEPSTQQQPSINNPQVIYDQFVQEFQQLTNKINEQTDDDELENICNYLITKYLVECLDKYPPSQDVSLIKKSISKMIEELASSGYVGEEEQLPSYKQITTKEDSINKASITTEESKSQSNKSKVSFAKSPEEKAQLKATKGLPINKTSVNSSTNSSSTTTTKPIIDKQEAERLKIKAQYEEFMKLKKKTQEHPDSQTLNDYESLNSEINDVLKTIRSTTTK